MVLGLLPWTLWLLWLLSLVAPWMPWWSWIDPPANQIALSGLSGLSEDPGCAFAPEVSYTASKDPLLPKRKRSAFLAMFLVVLEYTFILPPHPP